MKENIVKAVPNARLLAASTAILALAGCASTSYESRFAWSDGWRKAEVVKVTTAAQMERPGFYTCVRRATPEQLAAGRFAVVEYRQALRAHVYAVPMGPGNKVSVGDAVYVKLGQCSTRFDEQLARRQTEPGR